MLSFGFSSFLLSLPFSMCTGYDRCLGQIVRWLCARDRVVSVRVVVMHVRSCGWVVRACVRACVLVVVYMCVRGSLVTTI